MDIMDVFFLSMVAVTGLAAFFTMGIRFFKECIISFERDKFRRRSDRNSFKFDRATGPMAIRNSK